MPAKRIAKSTGQLDLLPDVGLPRFPRTRYQGSKAKLVDWIWDSVRNLPFQSALDIFGGTGCVSYRLKAEGKSVTYNDRLISNAISARALIENDRQKLSSDSIASLVHPSFDDSHEGFIARTFEDIYYTNSENRWLDAAVCELDQMRDNPYLYSLAFFAVAQACIVKRPYNLFHRKNLYIRLADVKRGFGNKASWDRSFSSWIAEFAAEANRAVFAGPHPAKVLNLDAFQVPIGFDLVYMDPPYVTQSGTSLDYRDFYHFLEGLALYEDWPELIDYKSKHRRFIQNRDVWTRPKEIASGFDALFQRHAKSHIVVSYRSDGIPSIDELVRLLKKYKKTVKVVEYGAYKYVFSRNSKSKEVLLIGEGNA